jgi:dTDP-4-dehydrorhamnose reductase
MINNIIVLGASGQLGNCIKEICHVQNINNVFFPTEKEADILNIVALEEIFKKKTPAYCINCAAYTAVDKAEGDVDIARKINAEGAANIATLCKKYNSIIFHISTDFVFEGNKPQLLSEYDTAKPISVYGLTKLEGEQKIIALTDKYYIIRTSWLYSEFGNNFVKTMQRLGRERDTLGVVSDQIGTPTYGVDLAVAIMHIIASGKQAYGIYHYSNEGVASWYDFAKAIFDLSDINVNLLPINTSDYVTRAVRPAFSVMDKTKIKSTFGIEIPYWRDSLARCINVLNS